MYDIFLQLFLLLKDEEILLQSRAEGSEKDGHCLPRLHWGVMDGACPAPARHVVHVKRAELHGQAHPQPGNGRSGAGRTEIPSKPLSKAPLSQPNLQCLGVCCACVVWLPVMNEYQCPASETSLRFVHQQILVAHKKTSFPPGTENLCSAQLCKNVNCEHCSCQPFRRNILKINQALFSWPPDATTA